MAVGPAAPVVLTLDALDFHRGDGERRAVGTASDCGGDCCSARNRIISWLSKSKVIIEGMYSLSGGT